MAKTIYDKPTRELLKDMVKDIGLQLGQVFTTSHAIKWFGQHYPKLQPNNIRANLVQSATNDSSRLHHASTSEQHDLLFKVGAGQFRLYEANKDPTPIYELVEGDVALEESLTNNEDDIDIVGAQSGSSEFLLERDLQRYLSENLECVEAGLKLYENDGIKGIEFEAGGGRRIDILAVDKSGNLVVLELKVSKGYDRVVGQLLRYVNWVRQNLAEAGQIVRGIIICRTMSEDLRLACASIQNVELFEYQLSVKVNKVVPLKI